MKESELFEFFHTLGIVPVVKIDDAAKAEALAGAMCRGGINCAEVTFRTDAAEEAIKRMVKAYPEMVVGAGTVLNPETAERAVKAGASFIVSPVSTKTQSDGARRTTSPLPRAYVLQAKSRRASISA